ncbi:hypothetical protein KPZU09_03930 [Klebsiella pneumoniae]|uniref:Uncharacterized protein n=1 Tax=Klebsiella pneumoniae TaxID=573 RepID=A0A919HQB5_KLEPN|nr:hypothetical protein KPZU09_03930 [Klebsiella pneumoniae]
MRPSDMAPPFCDFTAAGRRSRATAPPPGQCAPVRDIAAVAGRHLLHLQQRAPLFGQLFAQAQGGLQRLAALKGRLQVGKLQLTFADR